MMKSKSDEDDEVPDDPDSLLAQGTHTGADEETMRQSTIYRAPPSGQPVGDDSDNILGGGDNVLAQ